MYFTITLPTNTIKATVDTNSKNECMNYAYPYLFIKSQEIEKDHKNINIGSITIDTFNLSVFL